MPTEMSRTTAKKRAEIAEYTSLIRSLHTTSTQDALPRLLVPTPVSASFFGRSRTALPARQIVRQSQAAASSPPPSSTSLSDEDTQFNTVRLDLVPKSKAVTRGESSDGDILAEDRRFDGVEGSQEKRKGRSTWTRWPLLKRDVYIPEWTLQDEVQTLASRATREWINTHVTTGSDSNQDIIVSQPLPPDEVMECSTLRDNSPPTSPQPSMTKTDTGDIPINQEAAEDSPAGNSSLESAMLHPGVISGLTLGAENFLSHIFGALAAQWPLVDKSAQGRLQPMDGRAVLEVVGQAGIVNSE
jgi:hypothetical protein